MFNTTGDERHMEELEAKVFGTPNLYLEARRRKVEQHKKVQGPGLRPTESCGGSSQRPRRSLSSSAVTRQNFRRRP